MDFFSILTNFCPILSNNTDLVEISLNALVPPTEKTAVIARESLDMAEQEIPPASFKAEPIIGGASQLRKALAMTLLGTTVISALGVTAVTAIILSDRTSYLPPC